MCRIPYYPQTAGLIERYNGLLKDQIRKLTPTHTLRGLDQVLTQAVMLLNFRPIAKSTPYERILGDWGTDSTAGVQSSVFI